MTPLVAVPQDETLTQGDILDGCPVYCLPAGAATDRLDQALEGVFARVIVLTQACDLANAKATRAQVAVVHGADELVDAGVLKAAQVRDQVRRGQVYGWYFLPAAPDLGLPESVIDLRDLHTIPRPVLEGLAATGKRRARLVTPFREHLAQHFAVTYMRIALPDPYDTRP